jgi:hypothetical protein
MFQLHSHYQAYQQSLVELYIVVLDCIPLHVFNQEVSSYYVVTFCFDIASLKKETDPVLET